MCKRVLARRGTCLRKPNRGEKRRELLQPSGTFPVQYLVPVLCRIFPRDPSLGWTIQSRTKKGSLLLSYSYSYLDSMVWFVNSGKVSAGYCTNGWGDLTVRPSSLSAGTAKNKIGADELSINP